YRARPISEVDHPRLYRVVNRVATQAVMPVPKVYIIRSKAPNAFATGRNADHAAVAATEGLLQILSEEELEGVMGHEVAHILNRDMLIGTITATFAGAIGLLAYIVRWGAFFGGYGYGRDAHRGGGIGQLLAALVAPLAAVIIQAAISRQREYKADAQGGSLTGKYLALASALDKIHKAPTRFAIEQHPSTAHLMIANPLSRRSFSSLFSTHPPVEKRIARLEKLSQQSIYSGYA
ncbi:MAG: M48 family metalloprotease, partial [candidate division Zixibacteria bacterium]|nr:M48 family metalloprotease [candidate division Zixibacteria bacterium]